jgi:hypothetical protein
MPIGAGSVVISIASGLCFGVIGSVESYAPPRTAAIEEVFQWEDSVRDMKQRLGKVRFGGQALRDMARDEARALDLLRHQLFCKYL